MLFLYNVTTALKNSKSPFPYLSDSDNYFVLLIYLILTLNF